MCYRGQDAPTCFLREPFIRLTQPSPLEPEFRRREDKWIHVIVHVIAFSTVFTYSSGGNRSRKRFVLRVRLCKTASDRVHPKQFLLPLTLAHRRIFVAELPLVR